MSSHSRPFLVQLALLVDVQCRREKDRTCNLASWEGLWDISRWWICAAEAEGLEVLQHFFLQG